MSDLILYNEQGEAKPVRITEDEAIRRQVASAEQKGYKYSSNDDALEDFLIVNWAWVQEPRI